MNPRWNPTSVNSVKGNYLRDDRDAADVNSVKGNYFPRYACISDRKLRSESIDASIIDIVKEAATVRARAARPPVRPASGPWRCHVCTLAVGTCEHSPHWFASRVTRAAPAPKILPLDAIYIGRMSSRFRAR